MRRPRFTSPSRAHDLPRRARRAREPRGARGRGEHEQREQHAEREHERAVRLRAHGERHAARLVAGTNAEKFIGTNSGAYRIEKCVSVFL